MNPIKIKILYFLRDIHLQNVNDKTSSYNDPVKGGTNSDNFYFIDSDFKKIEAEAVGLEQAGYLQFFDRGTVSKGLKITQAGLDWLTADESVQKTLQAQAEAAEAQKIVDAVTQAKLDLRLDDAQWDNFMKVIGF